jgi:hypothetical protein
MVISTITVENVVTNEYFGLYVTKSSSTDGLENTTNIVAQSTLSWSRGTDNYVVNQVTGVFYADQYDWIAVCVNAGDNCNLGAEIWGVNNMASILYLGN